MLVDNILTPKQIWGPQKFWIPKNQKHFGSKNICRNKLASLKLFLKRIDGSKTMLVPLIKVY